MNKLFDLVDFCVTKGIPEDFADVQSCFDLSSNHSPILVTLSSQALRREPAPSLCNRRTSFNEFRNLIDIEVAMTQSNGLAGTQRPNKQTHSRPMNALY
jgi:hypothetical protein